MGADQARAVFRKEEAGNAVTVGISNPWTDGKTGQQRFDTLIQILKTPE